MKVWLCVALVAGALTLHAGAQSYTSFSARGPAALDASGFSDQEVGSILNTLDRLLAEVPATAWNDRAGEILWQFARRVQAQQLTPAQETRVLARLDGLAATHPGSTALVAGPRRMIRDLGVGKPAPEIVGADLDGRPLRLSDYRNKVVLLVFSAEWCGICRALAPYERFLVDRYAAWPFALLGVETGSTLNAVRAAHASGGASHRAWWDEPKPGAASGVIARDWNVVGWPATYLIDGDGIIRFVDLREEDLLIAVRRLVEAEADRGPKSPPPR